MNPCDLSGLKWLSISYLVQSFVNGASLFVVLGMELRVFVLSYILTSFSISYFIQASLKLLHFTSWAEIYNPLDSVS